MLVRTLALAPLFLLTAFSLSAPAADVGQSAHPPVTTFTLDNGLDVVVIEDHRAPVVTHMVWYRVGSADEPRGKSGIAHFLEHLMFKGTDTVAPGEFSEQVALNGGNDNAFTSQDYTAYHQRIARDRLGLVMELESDRMANLSLSEAEVATEREVILEERAERIGSSPGAQLSEQMRAALYLNHPYKVPIIGWEHEMRGLTHADAVEFYDRFYTPSNAILIVAGDVMPDEVRELAEATYGTLANRTEIAERQRTSEPPHQAARRVVLEHPEARVERWRRIYLAPSYSTAGEGDGAALALLGEIMGGGSSSRLYRELVIDRKIAVDIAAYYSGLALDYGNFAISAVPAADVTMEALEAAIDEVVADIIRDGVSEEEFNRARTELIAESIYDRDNQSRLARTFGTALTTGLTVDGVISWTDELRASSPAAVREMARENLHIERSVTGLLLKPGDDGGDPT